VRSQRLIVGSDRCPDAAARGVQAVVFLTHLSAKSCVTEVNPSEFGESNVYFGRITEKAGAMKLIGSLGSPYVRKARIMLAEKKIDYKLVLENVWGEETAIHDFNPLGKVPCLVMEDGEAVFDSRVICEYVDMRSPVGKLIPQNGRERVEVRCWEALADGMLDAAVLIRSEYTQRTPEQRSEAWIERQQRKIQEGLKAMAKGLDANAWCAGNRYTLADIAVGCALGYLDFRQPELDWREPYPNLAKHFEKLMQRASFADTVPQG